MLIVCELLVCVMLMGCKCMKTKVKKYLNGGGSVFFTNFAHEFMGVWQRAALSAGFTFGKRSRCVDFTTPKNILMTD